MLNISLPNFCIVKKFDPNFYVGEKRIFLSRNTAACCPLTKYCFYWKGKPQVNSHGLLPKTASNQHRPKNLTASTGIVTCIIFSPRFSQSEEDVQFCHFSERQQTSLRIDPFVKDWSTWWFRYHEFYTIFQNFQNRNYFMIPPLHTLEPFWESRQCVLF